MALLTALSFGGLTTLATLYYRDGGNAPTMLLIRFAATTLALGAVLCLRGGCGRWRVGALAVGAAWSLGVLCYLSAVQYIDVGIAALILYTFPVLVLIMSCITRELRSTARLWAVFIAAFLGLCVMLLPSLGTFHRGGLLLAFGAALLFAATFFFGARASRGVPALSMAFQVTVMGLAITAPLVYWGDALALPRGDGWLWLGIATVLYTGGVLAQFGALARVRAAQAAMVMNLEPIVSVALAAWVLGERLTPLQWLGAAGVLGALLLSQRIMQGMTGAGEDATETTAGTGTTAAGYSGSTRSSR